MVSNVNVMPADARMISHYNKDKISVHLQSSTQWLNTFNCTDYMGLVSQSQNTESNVPSLMDPVVDQERRSVGVTRPRWVSA